MDICYPMEGRGRESVSYGYVLSEGGDMCYPREGIPPAHLPSPLAVFRPAPPRPAILAKLPANIAPGPHLCPFLYYFLFSFRSTYVCAQGEHLTLFNQHNHVILLLEYCYYNNIMYLCCVLND